MIAKILQGNDAMFAYNGAFSDEEVIQWFDNLMRSIKPEDLVYGQLY